MRAFLLGIAFLVLVPALPAADAPKRDWDAVVLLETARDYWYKRSFNSYYWREDFTFRLQEAGKERTWRILSREPTPAYDYRMGTTYTGLKVDWKAGPKVKVLAVKAVDRIPEEFYGLKLDEPNLATALIVWVKTKSGVWKEFYVNNWFHPWGPRADKVIYKYYADKPAPYTIYGFANGQTAPFAKKSQAVLDRHKASAPFMFHGRVQATKSNAFGYEIELIDLIGKDPRTGGATILFGDGKSIPRLDQRKPAR